MCDLTPAQIENKLNLIEKKESIEKHLKKTEEQTSLNDYIMNTGHILYDYYDESNIYKNALSPKSKKKSVLDFFGKVKKNHQMLIQM